MPPKTAKLLAVYKNRKEIKIKTSTVKPQTTIPFQSQDNSLETE